MQLQFAIATALGILQSLEGWSCRPQNYRRAELLASRHCQIARMVAKLLFLLERRIMLLIDDDDS